MFNSAGTGYGFDPSLGLKFGVVHGDASNFLGESRNMNIGLSLLSRGPGFSLIMDNNSNVNGGSVNFSGRLPFSTFSITDEHTWRWIRTEPGGPGD